MGSVSENAPPPRSIWEAPSAQPNSCESLSNSSSNSRPSHMAKLTVILTLTGTIGVALTVSSSWGTPGRGDEGRPESQLSWRHCKPRKGLRQHCSNTHAELLIALLQHAQHSRLGVPPTGNETRDKKSRTKRDNHRGEQPCLH